MKSPIKTISLPEETYNALKAQADQENRTIGGQIKHLLNLHIPNVSGQSSDERD